MAPTAGTPPALASTRSLGMYATVTAMSKIVVVVLLLPAGSAGASPGASIVTVVDHVDSDTDGMLFLSQLVRACCVCALSSAVEMAITGLARVERSNAVQTLDWLLKNGDPLGYNKYVITPSVVWVKDLIITS
ncbi:hypothetical protein BO79DRAFT_216253 [Aspergillus costaricaensis CBS 115574]|uniref:Uncharacterized protein n=1 Tax=Aspergillus costaricaensis CBS 115574 TaxID=1448317 RepID=A0ACD1IJW6_9EURO|nr:hypothetical protein BO79DRAFT_216253 [Aspergillus costaricaensis CBS 115574]RAK90070.1 hypothetical protein BO79DRAFT_216253 [Aspergillus costaricaensis CBS 115574]